MISCLSLASAEIVTRTLAITLTNFLWKHIYISR